MKAGHNAGKLIEKVPTTILHALSCPMTGLYEIPHVDALGILLLSVCKLMNELEIHEKIEPFTIHQYTYNVDIVIEEVFEVSSYQKCSKSKKIKGAVN